MLCCLLLHTFAKHSSSDSLHPAFPLHLMHCTILQKIKVRYKWVWGRRLEFCLKCCGVLRMQDLLRESQSIIEEADWATLRLVLARVQVSLQSIFAS